MKLFVCIALATLAYAAANPTGGAIVANSGSSSSANVQEADSEVQQQVVPVSLGDLTRLRKSAYGSGSSGGHSGASSGGYGGASSGGYGGSSMQAPACPKNYVFSCQPSLSPIACSSHSSHPSSYGSSGAYSAPVPTYVTPLRGNYGVPQGYSATAYVPQGFGFNPNNQYYQY